MENAVGYRKLLVWQRADELAVAVYQATKTFPGDEIYGITSQLRRAALSVPTNIVEYLLGFCRRLGYLNEQQYQFLEEKRQSVGGLLWNFYRSLF